MFYFLYTFFFFRAARVWQRWRYPHSLDFDHLDAVWKNSMNNNIMERVTRQMPQLLATCDLPYGVYVTLELYDN